MKTDVSDVEVFTSFSCFVFFCLPKKKKKMVFTSLIPLVRQKEDDSFVHHLISEKDLR